METAHWSPSRWCQHTLGVLPTLLQGRRTLLTWPPATARRPQAGSQRCSQAPPPHLGTLSFLLCPPRSTPPAACALVRTAAALPLRTLSPSWSRPPHSLGEYSVLQPRPTRSGCGPQLSAHPQGPSDLAAEPKGHPHQAAQHSAPLHAPLPLTQASPGDRGLPAPMLSLAERGHRVNMC